MMLNIRPRFLMVLGAAALLAFASCKKDDITDPDPDPTLNEASITFTVLDDSVKLSGVLVGINPDAGNRDAGIFTRSGTTDGTGKYKVSPVSPDVYYYSVSWTSPTGVRKRTGSVEVAQAQKARVEVVY